MILCPEGGNGDAARVSFRKSLVLTRSFPEGSYAREFTDTLTPAQVYRFAVDFRQPHLKFRTVGKKSNGLTDG
jgi:hypothetical protein